MMPLEFKRTFHHVIKNISVAPLTTIFFSVGKNVSHIMFNYKLRPLIMQRTVKAYHLRQANYSKHKQRKDNTYINNNFFIWVTFPKKKSPVEFTAETYRLLIKDDRLVNSHFKMVRSNQTSNTTILSINSLKIDFCIKCKKRLM